ncbi:MAG: IclR family transcriptional regulator [Micromonosporaceae bacterium]
MAKPHRTVGRISSILETVAVRPNGVKFTDLVDVLAAPKSSVHSLVGGLLSVGYLTERDGLLRLGPGIELLASPMRGSTLRRLARSELEALSVQTGETTVLSVRVGNSIVHIDQVESVNVLRYATQLNQRQLLASGSASGKALMTGLDEPYLRRLWELSRGESGDGFDETMLQRLLAEIDQVRRAGVAYNRGETVPSVWTLAAPVVDGLGKPVASLSVAGPKDRVSEKEPMIATAVARSAAELSARLGFKSQPRRPSPENPTRERSRS